MVPVCDISRCSPLAVRLPVGAVTRAVFPYLRRSGPSRLSPSLRQRRRSRFCVIADPDPPASHSPTTVWRELANIVAARSRRTCLSPRDVTRQLSSWWKIPAAPSCNSRRTRVAVAATAIGRPPRSVIVGCVYHTFIIRSIVLPRPPLPPFIVVVTVIVHLMRVFVPFPLLFGVSLRPAACTCTQSLRHPRRSRRSGRL